LCKINLRTFFKSSHVFNEKFRHEDLTQPQHLDFEMIIANLSLKFLSLNNRVVSNWLSIIKKDMSLAVKISQNDTKITQNTEKTC